MAVHQEITCLTARGRATIERDGTHAFLWSISLIKKPYCRLMENYGKILYLFYLNAYKLILSILHALISVKSGCDISKRNYAFTRKMATVSGNCCGVHGIRCYVVHSLEFFGVHGIRCYGVHGVMLRSDYSLNWFG